MPILCSSYEEHRIRFIEGRKQNDSFSKIDDKLTVYRDNQVILFGANEKGRKVKQVLERYGIPTAFFCDNDPEKWGMTLEGIPVFSPEQLKQKYDAKTVVQITCVPEFETAIEKQLREMGIERYITYTEHAVRMELLYLYQTILQGELEEDTICTMLQNFFPPSIAPVKRASFSYFYIVNSLKSDSYNILCLPPKTGDTTIERSRVCTPIRNGINCWHTLRHVPVEIRELLGNKKLKIVTAVREPISQNLSLFFHAYGLYGLNSEFWESGGDAQTLYSSWLDHVVGGKDVGADVRTGLPRLFWYDIQEKTFEIGTYLMQDFFEKNFEPYSHIDVFQYPFDKEKGYTIINVEGQNTEIFIYQLERINDIADELGRFLGIEDFHLVNGNIGEENWYADAYRQAKKEIKFPRAYFDACFNSRVMTHFYSDADIAKFKQRWLPHVED